MAPFCLFSSERVVATSRTGNYTPRRRSGIITTKSMISINRIHRVRVLIAAPLLVAVLLFCFPRPAQVQALTVPAGKLDFLIINGKVIDGSGKGARRADVGIRGDRIAFVGDAKKFHLEAARTIDVKGLVVAPGFIDPHTHTLADLTGEKTKSNQAYLMQGVTTVITGNDGGSVLTVGELLSRWEKQGVGTNAALLAGFGTIRGKVLGPGDAQPTAGQLEEEKQYVARAMDEGAFGISTGLY